VILAGIPTYLQNRQQSVLNTAARMIFGARLSDHVTSLLYELHRLRFPERIQYKLAVLAFCCLHGIAPSYFVRDLTDLLRAADKEPRRRLWSGSNNNPIVPCTSRKIVGDRMFSVAAARIWNSLPITIISASTLPIFKRLLKTKLFHAAYRTLSASSIAVLALITCLWSSWTYTTSSPPTAVRF
jgi:hypothetical protein